MLDRTLQDQSSGVLPQAIPSRPRWALSVRIFHWISVLLLVVTWLFVFLHHNTPDPSHVDMVWHRSLGLLFLLWVVSRLLNRFRTSRLTPAPINGIVWQVRLAQAVHGLLYVVMIAMPLSGLIMSLYGSKPISLFGVYDLPQLLTPDHDRKEQFEFLHTTLIWTGLWSLSALHILAAWFHQWVKKDKLIHRML